MSDETKYFCVKIGDWLDAWEALKDVHMDASGQHALTKLNKARLHDSVVIRRQDIFAAPAFAEYAGQISTTLEILEVLGVDKPENLEEIRDYFFEQAEMARLVKHPKLPD